MIGRVSKPIGLKGKVVVESLTDFPDRFSPGNQVLINGLPYKITEQQAVKQRFSIKLEGVDGLDAATKLRDQYIEIPESSLRSLPEGQYYRFQLIGLHVLDLYGRELGTITDVLETGSNDVYLVRGPEGEHLVPALSHFIKNIDLSSKSLIVDLPHNL